MSRSEERLAVPNKAPAPNRRLRFSFAAYFQFPYLFCAQPGSPAAVGEARRSPTMPAEGAKLKSRRDGRHVAVTVAHAN